MSLLRFSRSWIVTGSAILTRRRPNIFATTIDEIMGSPPFGKDVLGASRTHWLTLRVQETVLAWERTTLVYST
jgi:hypothetical protein